MASSNHPSDKPPDNGDPSLQVKRRRLKRLVEEKEVAMPLPRLPGECGLTTFISHNETYKVIELYNDAGNSRGQSCALIFNSTFGAWRRKRVEVSIRFTASGIGVHLHRVVYWVLCSPHKRGRNWNLLTFNIEEDAFDFLQIPPIGILKSPYGTDNLLVCNGSLFLVVINIDRRDLYEQVILLKFDPVSRTLVKVNDKILGSSSRYSEFHDSEPPATQGDNILFLEKHCNKVLAYDMRKEKWSSFSIPAHVPEESYYYRGGCRWTSPSFQPGLNPFLGTLSCTT